MNKKPINWLVIDENKKIIDKFRIYSTAFHNIRRLGKIHIGVKLKIISVEDYEELKKTPQKAPELKREVFYSKPERWIQ